MRLLARQLDLWKLTLDGKPFETPSSWLAYVLRDGVPAVLKIPKPSSDEHRGAIALEHFGDAAAVRVIAHDACAILMERIVPGTNLATTVLEGRDDDATRVICEISEKLAARGPPQTGNWVTLEHLANAFARYRSGPSHALLTPDLVDRAEAMFLELCATQSTRTLLHGDLHHMNILHDTHRGWLAIDPKGVIGEAAYEAAMALHNPVPHFELMSDPQRMSRRVRIFADRLKTGEERILRWCFAVDILCHLWTVEDGMDTSDFPRSLRVAKTALNLLALT